MTTAQEVPRVASASREIAASPGRIFELIADPAQQPRWDGNDNLAEAPAGQRVRRIGDVFTMTLTKDGAIRENHVVEFDEGRRIAWMPAEAGKRPPGHLWRWEPGSPTALASGVPQRGIQPIEDVRGQARRGLASARNRLRPAAGIDPGGHEGVRGIAMTPTRQILFIQGGGAGAHDEWDDKLVESLRRELGGGYEVRYPRMPDEGDPGYARWSLAIRREMADLDDGAVVAAHSAGATILVNTLAEQPPEKGLAAIVLIAAPFVGPGGWPSNEFELMSDLGARLPPGARVHVFHGLQDETAPPSHAGLYALAIPQAQVHQLPGRDHQLNNDLSEVAEAIRISRPGSVTHA